MNAPVKIGKKEARRQERKLAAIKRTVPLRLIAMSATICNMWMEAGKVVEGYEYDPIDIQPEEMKMMQKQWPKILKHRDTIMQTVGFGEMIWIDRVDPRKNQKPEDVSKKGFRDTMNSLFGIIMNTLEEQMPSFSWSDKLKVYTYAWYAALHDYVVTLMDEPTREWKWFEQTVGTMANKLIPADSVLTYYASLVFFMIRQPLLMIDADELEYTESEQERYLDACGKTDVPHETWEAWRVRGEIAKPTLEEVA